MKELQMLGISLTDFELEGLNFNLNLADGHAYQDLDIHLVHIVQRLPELWHLAIEKKVPEVEQLFFRSFQRCAQIDSLRNWEYFKICPTASNSIDIIGAVLAKRGLKTLLIEPTFDNLALLLQRRGVELVPLAETPEILTVEFWRKLDLKEIGALFLVNPNNPTGTTFSKELLEEITDRCALTDTLLIMDNSFRFHNRNLYDDHEVLSTFGGSFISVEDTGKVWSTLDMKASICICSSDLYDDLSEVYNELYLCHSSFVLLVLNDFIETTKSFGLQAVLWDKVDKNRKGLRQVIEGSPLIVHPRSLTSTLSVEWIDCMRTGLSDLELHNYLRDHAITVLPGRNFFWASGSQSENQQSIRLSLLKRDKYLKPAFERLGKAIQLLGLSAPA